jgi:cell division protein ZapA (FtsZ GTPase activity inhibitor)
MGEYVNRVAYELNERIKDTAAQYVGLSTNVSTVLAALNLTDELIKAREVLESVSEQLKELQEKLRLTEIKLNLATEKAESENKFELKSALERLSALEKENSVLRGGDFRNIKKNFK